MTPHEILIAARAKIDTPQKWCKGSEALNSEGEPVDTTDEGAVCFCAFGAINAVTPRYLYNSDAKNALRVALGRSFITDYNDRPETKHADIMALYDKAIEATEGKAK